MTGFRLKQEETWNCPFCNENTIHVSVFPSVLKETKGNWGGSKAAISKSKEKVIIHTGCSKCGKSKEEVEKTLKVGKELLNSEVLRRLKEAGLDPTKLK